MPTKKKTDPEVEEMLDGNVEEMAEGKVEEKTEEKLRSEDILTVDARDVIETDEDRENSVWFELRNAFRSHRILSGRMDAVERTPTGMHLVIVYYKDFRVVIPYEEMNIEVAKLWINDIRFTEVADISTMFLFSKFSYADKLIIDNINSEDDNKKYFAMRLFIRLVINKTEINSNIIAMVKEAANRYINSDNIAVATIANDIILRLEN